CSFGRGNPNIARNQIPLRQALHLHADIEPCRSADHLSERCHRIPDGPPGCHPDLGRGGASAAAVPPGLPSSTPSGTKGPTATKTHPEVPHAYGSRGEEDEMTMGSYVEIRGAKTWYEQEGAGDPLLLLHGGFCTNATWEAQRSDFATRYRLFLAERRGHGHTPDVVGPLSYQDMADDTVAFIESVVDG